ncbi:hypothetical protein FJT64_013780 [Amphibalanus amphitrite]|uniref:Uncharacterized protein n=1 Tax=Amphibalanus amphitrite TaxID=1232801 RepID=A0A6A4UZ93_AMPAM|nr:hypothetical protein FJT64_013780 [Amphibalanus amphitrite]
MQFLGPYQLYRHEFTMGLPQDSTVGQTLWYAGGRLREVISGCEPACRPQESVPYPGGRVEVGIGSWESWPSLSESTLCHTLTPNVTWSQLADQKRVDLELKLNTKGSECDYRLFVHPRREPVMSGLGVRGVQQDLRLRYLCHAETSDRVSVQLISRVLDRESLNRAPCHPANDYYYESCIMDCAHHQWAERENCSTPEMLRDFPQLVECSKTVLRRAQGDGSLAVSAAECPCLPACHTRSFVADTGVETFPVSSTWTKKRPLVVRVAAASVAEEVSTERRSYRLPSLLSEMGGFVSLVLGVSVLSVVDTIIAAIAGRGITQTAEPARPGTATPDRRGTTGPDRRGANRDHSWTTTLYRRGTTGPDHESRATASTTDEGATNGVSSSGSSARIGAGGQPRNSRRQESSVHSTADAERRSEDSVYSIQF